MKILALIASALSLVVLPATAEEAKAVGYPAKPIRIVVPFAAGGTSDVLARILGERLSTVWGKPVIVDNRPGADGNLGADAVAKSPPDGHTLLLLDVSTLTVSPLVMAKLTYNPTKDLAPVTMVSFSAHALVVNPALPVKSFAELVAYSRANPDKLNFAAGNQVTRLVAEHLKQSANLNMLPVPYKGGSAALNALIGGEVNVSLVGLLASLPHVQGHRLRAIATTGPKRSETLPQVPTLAESGLPNFVSGSWQGLLAPAGTPPAIIAKLNATVVAALKEPAMKAKLAEQGTEVVGDTPEHFAAFLRSDAETWKKVAEEAHIKPE
jgi:tripartite-type tricarboxylate transporter receptor subunit TctC